MLAFALLFLAAVSTSVQLVDEVYTIPRNDWRFIDVDLKQRPAVVDAEFDVRAGSQQLRLALLRRADVERLRAGDAHGLLAVTEPGGRGAFRYRVPERGEYAIVVYNRAGGTMPATVRLRVDLDFSGPETPGVTRLSPQRQLTVIAISFAAFFAILTFSGLRLWRAIRQPE